MGAYVIDLLDREACVAASVGGKGANLSALTEVEGAGVPAGFVVPTEVYRQVLASSPAAGAALEGLAALAPGAGAEAARFAAALRAAIEAAEPAPALRAAVAGALAALGGPVAVRSSATVEDQPDTSFAGQADSFLGVEGVDAVLAAVRRCLASLHSERAVAWRAQHGVDHRAVAMAVVVQRMVPAEVSGVLFTADPVSGHRGRCVVEAVAGLGDVLVSGRVTPHRHVIGGGAVLGYSPGDGDLGADRVLTDAELLALEALGRRVEAHFGQPQDIEWCLAAGRLHLVQSRAITTLFPIPGPRDGGRRVYLSVGHQQMMTDALKPLGLSVFQRTALRPMYEAGGRLFVDPTRELANPAIRPGLVAMTTRHDPLTGDALRRLVEREGFFEPPAAPAPGAPAPGAPPAPPFPGDDDGPAVAALTAAGEAALEASRRALEGLGGVDLVDAVLADIEGLKRELTEPRSVAVVMAGLGAAAWLDDQVGRWLGEAGVSGPLSQAVSGDVSAEMGLALLDVADRFRPHPELVAHLASAGDEQLLPGLLGLPGGLAAHAALSGWLARYGARCPGEIDLTRPRFHERPTLLAPLLGSLIRSFAPGEAARRVERGRAEAGAREAALLERLRAGPEGEARAAEVARMIRRLRTFIGYREYPKYTIIRRYDLYRRHLRAEGARLVAEGVLAALDDLDFLPLPELRELLRTGVCDRARIEARRAEHTRFQRLSPPRVITSEGEIVIGAYPHEERPPGALVGLPVSPGVVEGRARVLLDVGQAALEPGDILVTRFADPSWTPLFVAVAALVTEVGGLMTHGAVIAREYGLPAVIGVDGATRRIPDGARIRVDGARGFVEVLS